MIPISHRINTIDQINSLDPKYGAELDIHAYGDRLVVAHDAMCDGPELAEWLEVCGDRFVIFNIKEEGIENNVIDIVEKSSVCDFFFLDLSFPAMMRLSKTGFKKMALRVSEFESTPDINTLENLFEWVWLDCFNGYPLDDFKTGQLNMSSLKVCIVSPELHGPHRTKGDFEVYKSAVMSRGLKYDAVCTKHPQWWGC